MWPFRQGRFARRAQSDGSVAARSDCCTLVFSVGWGSGWRNLRSTPLGCGAAAGAIISASKDIASIIGAGCDRGHARREATSAARALRPGERSWAVSPCQGAEPPIAPPGEVLADSALVAPATTRK
jgi:hypothetical protein